MAEIRAEYIYFLMPIGSLSRMIGGTWWKAMDRFIMPIIIVLTLYLFKGWSWWLLPTLASYLAVKTLPLTLIGDSIRGSLINRIWVFILGFLQALPCVIIFYDELLTAVLLCLIPMVVYGVVLNLSNVSITSRLFRHKYVEAITGAIYLFPICYQLGG